MKGRKQKTKIRGKNEKRGRKKASRKKKRKITGRLDNEKEE